MQREEKKGKGRSIYSGELVFEIKYDFVFPCVIKSFSFLLFLLLGRMDSTTIKMIRLTKNINLFQFLRYNLQVGLPEVELPDICQSSLNHSKSNNDIVYRVKVVYKIFRESSAKLGFSFFTS